MNDLSPPSVTDSFTVLEPVTDARLRPSRQTRRPKPLHHPVRRIVVFLLLVALPVAATAIYEFGLAADRFETESVYVVRNPGDGGASSIGTSGQAAGNVFSRAGLPLVSNDSFAVQEFILSRDAMSQA